MNTEDYANRSADHDALGCTIVQYGNEWVCTWCGTTWTDAEIATNV